jgi:hypothetical protein
MWTLNVLYGFSGTSDGSNPGGLIMMGPLLYGTTFSGPTKPSCAYDPDPGCGTIFAAWPEQLNAASAQAARATRAQASRR